MEVAANAAWPYAMLCGWTYLNDHAAAHDIMGHAVENASGYISRHVDCSDKKVLSRTKSVIKRRARQEAARRSREIQFGSLFDMEELYIGQPEATKGLRNRDLRAPFPVRTINRKLALAGVLMAENRRGS